MMLASGKNVEMGTPKELMSNPNSGFSTYLKELKKEQETGLW